MKKAFFLALTVLLLVSCNDPNHKKPEKAHLIKNAVEDIDGNKYDAVKIGNQVWMAENLRTTRYADGTEIPLNYSSIQVSDTEMLKPSRFCPNGKNDNVETYGYLYNWGAVMHNSPSSNENPSGVQGICPTGWHVPSQAEWEELINTVRSNDKYKCDGCEDCIAKALASPTGWKVSSNSCAVGNAPETNNATHFSAVPAGDCDPYSWMSGHRINRYEGFGSYAYFWTSSEVQKLPGIEPNFTYRLYYNKANISQSIDNPPAFCYSVRCVKD